MRLKKWVKIALFSFSMLSIVVLAEKRRSSKVCQRILIDVDNRHENYFVNEKDVQMLVTNAGADNVIGKRYLELDLKALEHRIEANKYVRRAEVYRDVKGNLLVYVEQNRPLARLLRQDAPDAYISDAGEVLPVSDAYTARVMLISGPYTERLIKHNITEDGKNQQVFALIDYISRDEFWKSQIAGIDIDENGDITMYPQIGKQRIEFGRAENISDKFDKLSVFYDQILPRKGWNFYNRVNLKYQDQIVCD